MTQRKSIRAQLATPSVSIQAADAAILHESSELTETGTFRLEATGELSAVVGAKANPAEDWTRLQGQVDPQLAATKVLLTLSDEVESAEVEALAVSLWESAGWVAPGKLALEGPASLSGPWQISRPLARQLGIRNNHEVVYVLDCPPERGKPIPQVLRGLDDLMEAFLPGPPEGLELQIIHGLNAIARRLSGGLRIPDTNFVHLPDPDSAVNLSVYSDQLADPTVLARLLRPALPNLQINLNESQPYDVPLKVQVRPNQPVPDSLTRGEREWIHSEADAYDQAALEGNLPDEVTGMLNVQGVRVPFDLYSEIGGGSAVSVVVEKAFTVPSALRWEPWAKLDRLILYEINWVPSIPAPQLKNLNRAGRRERLRASKRIESIAAMLVSAVGGAILDEDAFLVAL